jgi:hypothetical protein
MQTQNRFTIKIQEKVFTSNEDGFLNLNEIHKAFDLPKSKAPSQWRGKDKKYFESYGHLRISRLRTDKNTYYSYEGDKISTIAYASWCKLPIDNKVEVVKARDEEEFGKLLKQIFPDLITQYPYKDGKYFVDFYIPSLKLNIEYDEKHHKSTIQRFKDAERELEIGGAFYRVSQGKEVEALIDLSQYKKKRKSKPKGYCVDGKYFFKDEMKAFKFCVSIGTNDIVKTKIPDTVIEQKYIVASGKYPMVYFPLVDYSEEDILPY